jgi:hypothetical protein
LEVASHRESKVTLNVNEGTFRGLSKQNLLFHQCIWELTDNAIAAKKGDELFRVDISMERRADGKINLYIADKGKGMTLEVFKKAIQLGESATTEHRLNEHGFGLKNALATLSGGNGNFQIWTYSMEEDTVHTVQGPFKQEMVILSDVSMPNLEFLPGGYTTIIKVTVPLTFIQTVQGRGARAKDLNTLRAWLIEHLGVMYRGYFELEDDTGEPSGHIYVSIGEDRKRVPAVRVPMANSKTVRFDIEIGGQSYNLEYTYGTLDLERVEKLVAGNKAKYYYQKNQTTQGIDIRLGKRVIATKQLENIWRKRNGEDEEPISRHNRYNEFVGELLIPDLPRGVLTTINNKTDFNLDDEDWEKIFQKLNEYRPVEDIKKYTEKGLVNKWIQMIKATNPNDTVTDEHHVWPTGNRIDIYRKTPTGEVYIYEMKVGSGSPIDLYQLKMYWDGLLLAGTQPSEGVLLVETFSSTLEEMSNLIMEHLTPPPLKGETKPSDPYNFKIEKHHDKGLR